MESSSDLPRFFVDQLPDALPADGGAEAVLTAGEAHHALHVLRLRTGAGVELFDGTGRRAQGRIARAGRSELAVELLHCRAALPPARPEVHVAFAVPKGNRLDWLLEKATELAARSLTPVRFARSVAGGDEPSPGKLDKWRQRCIAAAKQSRLDRLPELDATCDLPALLARPRRGPALLGDLGEAAVPIATALGDGAGEVHILIGPEGGLTDGERTAALSGGYVPVRLGPTTLRIETAAVALLAAVRAICDRTTP